MDPLQKAIRLKNQFKSVEGIFIGYYDNSKAYKVWIPRTNTVLKVRDAIFNESNHIERVTMHATDNDDLPDLWTQSLNTTFSCTAKPLKQIDQEPNTEAPVRSFHEQEDASDEPKPNPLIVTPTPNIHDPDKEVYEPEYAPKDFQCGPWLDPDTSIYGRGK